MSHARTQRPNAVLTAEGRRWAVLRDHQRADPAVRPQPVAGETIFGTRLYATRRPAGSAAQDDVRGRHVSFPRRRREWRTWSGARHSGEQREWQVPRHDGHGLE